MIFKLGAEEISSVNLVSLEDVESKGILGKAWSNIKLLVYKFLMEGD